MPNLALFLLAAFTTIASVCLGVTVHPFAGIGVFIFGSLVFAFLVFGYAGIRDFRTILGLRAK